MAPYPRSRGISHIFSDEQLPEIIANRRREFVPLNKSCIIDVDKPQRGLLIK